MKCFIAIAAVLHVALTSHVNVQMPYLNPAGVTYVNGLAQAAPLASPLTSLSSTYSTSTYYGNGHFLQSALHQAPAPAVAHQVATPVVAPAAAVVPAVHHVPAIANVPVTRIQAQPGFIHKEVDVAKPAVRTNRFELRRPAIQKQFFDIEERVIVRPAGSALVELDQPHTKVHKSSVVSPLTPAHISPAVVAASPAPPAFASPLPSFIQSSGFGISSTPSPIGQGISSDDDSVVIEARRLPQPQIPQQEEQPQPIQRTDLPLPSPQLRSHQINPQLLPQLQTQVIPRSQSELRLQEENQQRLLTLLNAIPSSQPQLPQSQLQTQAVVRSQAEQSGNQQRLIELLTAREGVADVGFSGPSFRGIGDAGHVRARVLSAEVASRDVPVTGERVNTRRVVVSRPIETVEEVDVAEPVTKLERVALQHPALFKTAHIGYERVPTSLPVLGKAITPVAPVAYSQPLYYQ